MTAQFTSFPILETPRLLLRRMSMADDEQVFEIRSRHNPYVDYKLAETIDDARDFITRINKMVDDGEVINWAITLKPEKELVGAIIYWNISADRLTAEIGYELRLGKQGKGIMQEAVKAVLDFGFEQLGFENIEAYTKPGHNRSLNVLRKFNFKQATNLRDADPDIIYILAKAHHLNKQ